MKSKNNLPTAGKCLSATLVATFVLLGGACASDDIGEVDINLPSCEEDTRDETFVSGISKTGNANYTIKINDSLPAPPAKGDNVWTIEMLDEASAPMTGLSFHTSTYMPDHGHYSPIIADVTEVGDGVYTLNPVNLFMPGYWEISITAIDPGATESPDDDAEIDTMMFKFCVEG